MKMKCVNHEAMCWTTCTRDASTSISKKFNGIILTKYYCENCIKKELETEGIENDE
jgi:hypothetical protein